MTSGTLFVQPICDGVHDFDIWFKPVKTFPLLRVFWTNETSDLSRCTGFLKRPGRIRWE